MAYVWTLGNEQWLAHPLAESAYLLQDNACKPIGENEWQGPHVLIRRGSDEPGVGWVIVADPQGGVRVNAEPLTLGIRVLQNRDEITAPQQFRNDAVRRYYFSTESPAVVETMPEASCSGVCPRCRGPFSAGKKGVCCPLCRVFHHQDEADGQCWTYDAVCANCLRHPTSLDGQLQWTPHML